jgi:HB1, ASXL, restriction endonuclease HTH domain
MAPLWHICPESATVANTPTPDPYDLVLRDLRAQRDKIDAAIEAIESVRGFTSRATTQIAEAVSIPSPPPEPVPTAPETAITAPVAAPTSGSASYAGLTVYDAARKVLQRFGKPIPQQALTDGIQDGGLKLNAIDPYNTVGSVLTRRFYEHGDIVRVARGTWALPEWFPDRDFRAEALRKKASRK